MHHVIFHLLAFLNKLIVESFALLGCFYDIEWFVQHDMYYVERFVLRWMLSTTLNDLYYVEWFKQRWMICTTLNDLYCV